jgi:thymidylate synthase (FAD)
VGLVWNEVSRRYVDSPPEFYEPDLWRLKALNVKQGSSDETLSSDHAYDLTHLGYWEDNASSYDGRNHETMSYSDICSKVYDDLLEAGVAPEQARMVLPQSMMTEWIWTGSLVSWARIYKLRTDPHTQSECRTIAHAIGNELREAFLTHGKALTNG